MVDEALVAKIEKKAIELQKSIVEMLGPDNAGHLGGSCSSAHIVAALYYSKMKHSPKDPSWDERDRFIISKGHSVLVQYAALADFGYFPKEELSRLKTQEGILQGHPDRLKTPGIEMSSGSLGQGLSVAVGLALSLRLRKKTSRVYVVLGDGELQEGQIWEAAMAASNYRVDNLLAFVDNNGIQATGPIQERFNSYPIPDKWKACNWNVLEIDGHSAKQVLAALDEAETVKGRPTVVVAHTVKGKNVSFAEHNPVFHCGIMSREQYDTALKELSEKLAAIAE